MLIVENGSHYAEVLSGIVKQAGHWPQVVDTGREVLETIASETSPTLVLLGLDLLGISGEDVMNAIKRSPEWNKVFILAISEDREMVRKHEELG